MLLSLPDDQSIFAQCRSAALADVGEGVFMDGFKPEPHDSGIITDIFSRQQEAHQLFILMGDNCEIQIEHPRGYIMTPDEWKEFKSCVDDYYASTDPQEIYDHNIFLRHPPKIEASEPKPEWKLAIPQSLTDRPENGWTYLVSSPAKRGYKIGATSKRLRPRLKRLSTALKADVTCLNAFHTRKPFEVETALHVEFAGKHIAGDWFALNEQDIAQIRPLVEGRIIRALEG